MWKRTFHLFSVTKLHEITQFFRRWWPNLAGVSLIFSPTRSTDTPSHCRYASQLKKPCIESSYSGGFVTTTISVIIGFWKWCFYVPAVSAMMHLWEKKLYFHNAKIVSSSKIYSLIWFRQLWKKMITCHFIRIAHLFMRKPTHIQLLKF